MQVATKSLNLSSLLLVFLLSSSHSVFGQASPTPTPDDRGLGIQSNTSTSSSSANQAREAKPELVLQTGYNNLFGATKMLFSPDGRLLATGTYRSSTIKL